MANTYSYDPTKITDADFNQMRFEIGDTDIDGKAQTCALCDEEYTALINKAKNDGQSWNYAKFQCLKGIHAKFSFEVDSSVGGMNLSLSDRFKRWDQLYLRMMKQFQYPIANPQSLGVGMPDGGHYFNLGQGNNPRTLSP
jgi:hypothetical protein